MNYFVDALGWIGMAICVAAVAFHHRGKIKLTSTAGGVTIGNALVSLGYILDWGAISSVAVVIHGTVAAIAALTWCNLVRRARKIGHTPAQ